MDNTLKSQAASVEINNEEYPKNTLAIEINGENVIVKTVAEGKTLGQGVFTSWRTVGLAPFATKALLITALRTALYA